VEWLLNAVGTDPATATQRDVCGEQVTVVPVNGDGWQMWRQARTTLDDHYPVLVFFAGLTARTTERAYARALLQLDHWTLYDRP